MLYWHFDKKVHSVPLVHSFYVLKISNDKEGKKLDYIQIIIFNLHSLNFSKIFPEDIWKQHVLKFMHKNGSYRKILRNSATVMQIYGTTCSLFPHISSSQINVVVE